MPQYIPTHAVEVALLDSEHELLVSYSTAANQATVGETFSPPKAASVAAMMRTSAAFAATLAPATPSSVQLVGKEHILFAFPVARLLLVIWIECLEEEAASGPPSSPPPSPLAPQPAASRSHYQALIEHVYPDLLGVARSIESLLAEDPTGAGTGSS